MKYTFRGATRTQPEDNRGSARRANQYPRIAMLPVRARFWNTPQIQHAERLCCPEQRRCWLLLVFGIRRKFSTQQAGVALSSSLAAPTSFLFMWRRCRWRPSGMAFDRPPPQGLGRPAQTGKRVGVLSARSRLKESEPGMASTMGRMPYKYPWLGGDYCREATPYEPPRPAGKRHIAESPERPLGSGGLRSEGQKHREKTRPWHKIICHACEGGTHRA